MKPELSIIIPCYNEGPTIARVVEEAFRVSLGGALPEIIVVDDGSTDDTKQVLNNLAVRYPAIKNLCHGRNLGKGAAIRTALPAATGEFTIIRDADLEYETGDILPILSYAKNNRLDAVFGSRNLRHNKASSSLFYWGGRAITTLANVLYGQKLTDEPTGYKLVRTALLKSLDIKSTGFEFCPEVTAKLARLGYKIQEIPIAYNPRTAAEGKKIRMRDGWQAVVTLIKYRLWQPADHFNSLDRFIRWLRVRRALAVAPASGRVLDIGCGPTAYLHRYLLRKKIDHIYIGVDRRPPVTLGVAEGFVAYDIETGGRLPLADSSADRVYLLALIEHVQNPAALLAEARRILAPGGVLTLTTPAPEARMVLELMAALRLINHDEIDEHEHYFSPLEVKAVLVAAGFAADKIQCGRFELGLNVVAAACRE